MSSDVEIDVSVPIHIDGNDAFRLKIICETRKIDRKIACNRGGKGHVNERASIIA